MKLKPAMNRSALVLMTLSGAGSSACATLEMHTQQDPLESCLKDQTIQIADCNPKKVEGPARRMGFEESRFLRREIRDFM